MSPTQISRFTSFPPLLSQTVLLPMKRSSSKRPTSGALQAEPKFCKTVCAAASEWEVKEGENSVMLHRGGLFFVNTLSNYGVELPIRLHELTHFSSDTSSFLASCLNQFDPAHFGHQSLGHCPGVVNYLGLGWCDSCFTFFLPGRL